VSDAEPTDADREYARRWAAARGLSPYELKVYYPLWAWRWNLKFGVWRFADGFPSESAAWDAVAVALRDLRRAVEIPAGPPSPVPHEAAA
jgi:hypothetical protein